MTLELIGQGDYSGGIFPALARHLIPDNGLYDLQNGLLDDDGSLYRRGGSQYFSASGLGSTGLTWIWDGYLAAGPRTVVATPTTFGVLDGADSAIVNLGGAGLAQPKNAIVIGGVLLIGGGVMYAGSRMTADYAAGTVSVTNGSKVVTGVGTSWTANVDVGMLFRVGSGRYYVVQSVDSNTQITLTEAYEGGTAGTLAYTLTRLGTFPRISDNYIAVADRVLSLEGNRVYFSRQRSSGASGLPPAGQLQYQTFDATDYHELPAGLNITGGRDLRGNAIVFATRGVFVISNLALPLTDPSGAAQQRLERLDPDFMLWTNEGIAAFGNRLVVPGVDGCYLIDGISAPERLTRSLGSFWTAFARGGRRTGVGIVYRSQYLLPILDASNALVDFLVCRPDRPIRSDLGVVYPWSRHNGAGVSVAALTLRSPSTTGARNVKLLAASRDVSSRVLDLSGFFEPAAGIKNDHDGTTHVMDWTTRDFMPGDGAIGTVKKLRLRYELYDAATDAPTILAYGSKGTALTTGAVWGAFLWGALTWVDATLSEFVLMRGSAPVSTGRAPFVFRTLLASRLVRFRFRSSGPAARLSVRSFDADVRKTIKR